MSKRFTGWIGAASLAVLSIACNNTADGVKRDAEENKRAAAQATEDARERADRAGDRASDTADRAGDRISEAARDTKDAIGTAGNKIGDATASAGRATEAAAETAEVKTALMADKRVDASDINVDTDGDTKTVILKGHVPNASQKSIAERIARDKAEGYHVKNELMVRN
jgi:hyperosmotically inducible periplasmic protein